MNSIICLRINLWVRRSRRPSDRAPSAGGPGLRLRQISVPLGEQLRRLLLTSLLLGLEFAVVFADERLDLRGAGKYSEPLLLVEGDGETSHSVEGYGTFLADLKTQPC